MTDAMRSEFEEWYAINAFDYAANPIGSRECGLQWGSWQACAARMVPLHAEQIRVAAVAAIREVTGCPDIKGNDGAYLVDALIVNLLEMQSCRSIAAEREKK